MATKAPVGFKVRLLRCTRFTLHSDLLTEILQNLTLSKTFFTTFFLTDPTHDLAKIRRLKSKRLEGTCEWISKRDEFKSWIKNPGLQLMWLIGSPGIGKTVLCDFVSETLSNESGLHVSYFFCNNQDNSRNSASAILRGVIWQLLQKFPELFTPQVEEYYRRGKVYLVQDLDALWETLVQMLHKAPGGSNICILIDALDECENSSSALELLGLLAELKSPVTAKILITSRPESHIEDFIQRINRTQPICSQCLRVDSADINDDLSKFIDDGVDDLRETKKGWPELLIEDIGKALKTKAGGTFLWVSLVLKDIRDSKMARKAREKLTDLPSDLPEIYRRILLGITEEYTNEATFVLQWVVASRRPMRPLELATAWVLCLESRETMAPSKDDLEELRDVYTACGSFLKYDADTDTINFVHQSAKEYLLNKPSPPRYRVDIQEASVTIVEACWRYLGMQDFKGCDIFERLEFLQKDIYPSVILDGRNILRRISARDPFFGYAVHELRDNGVHDRPDIYALFVEKCRDLDSMPDLRDWWLAQFAYVGQRDVVKSLLKKGANTHIGFNIFAEWPQSYVLGSVGLRGEENDYWLDIKLGALAVTALGWAVDVGFAEVCRNLIEAGADVNASGGPFASTSGSTVLHLAGENGNAELVKLLLENGALIKKDDCGETPLDYARQSGSKEVALLLQQYEDVSCLEDSNSSNKDDKDDDEDDEDDDMQTTEDNDMGRQLVAAVFRGDCELAQSLLENGAQVNIVDKSDSKTFGTPLSIAAEAGNLEMVALLLNKGADIAGYRFGPAPLAKAAREGHEAVVSLLIQKGANVNQMSRLSQQEKIFNSADASYIT